MSTLELKMAQAPDLDISERHGFGLQEVQDLVQIQDPGHPVAQVQDPSRPAARVQEFGHQAVQGHDTGLRTAEAADEPPAGPFQHQSVMEDPDDDPVGINPSMSLKT